MIGTGCGNTVVHFSRAGVIGSGARLNCGTPTSLETVEIAIDGGVVDEPMMMSALDSVTNLRALVVAAVGSPASSSRMVLILAPPISVGTNSSAFFSGMPSAAAGPVVLMLMPMVMSCASVAPGKAIAAARTAAVQVKVFMSSSLESLF